MLFLLPRVAAAQEFVHFFTGVSDGAFHVCAKIIAEFATDEYNVVLLAGFVVRAVRRLRFDLSGNSDP